MKVTQSLALAVTLLLTQCLPKPQQEAYNYIRSDIPAVLLQMDNFSPLLHATWSAERDVPNSPSACAGEGISRGFSYAPDMGYAVNHGIIICHDVISAQKQLDFLKTDIRPLSDVVSTWYIDPSRKPLHADTFSGTCRIRRASAESDPSHHAREATHCQIFLRYSNKVSYFILRYPEKTSTAFTEEEALKFINDPFDLAMSRLP